MCLCQCITISTLNLLEFSESTNIVVLFRHFHAYVSAQIRCAMLQVRVWTTSLMKWCAMLNLKGLHRFSMPYLGEVINSLMKWYVILRGRVRSTRLGIQCAEAAARAGVASAPYQAALCVPMHSRFTASLLSGVTTRIVARCACLIAACTACPKALSSARGVRWPNPSRSYSRSS